MNEKENLIIKEKAYKDYISGMKYKDIADKYSISINTIKSWKRRLNWQRKMNTKRVQVCKRCKD
ncbi:LuxR C-terminal-related transcriptional regulator [Clostridium botulinum]|uniref:LuxR C-terminal-related transcriptional regulator n=1 Tax=Clostridium botulinum TaxID=1491 RepID=UPI00064CAF94|nr:LuxR C-terminal-related transcriptional regulator [Clostridium botulinum]